MNTQVAYVKLITILLTCGRTEVAVVAVIFACFIMVHLPFLVVLCVGVFLLIHTNASARHRQGRGKEHCHWSYEHSLSKFDV